MADVSHELGSLRHIVDSPLSSKVAMFNKVADTHNASQLLNPFSNRGSSPAKPVFSKDEYGKPLAGSLTEMRGQKANIHVCKEMLELCQIIDSEGFPHPENPSVKVIFFGDLFNIYNHISDKCVGLLLRARKHKLVEFEGEMLFQRRDDEVPIITTKPIIEIRRYLEAKQEEFRRSVSPAPRPTSVIQDNMRRAVSQTPSSSPLASKAGTPRSLSPQLDAKIETPQPTIVKPQPTLRQVQSTPEIKIVDSSNSDNIASILEAVIEKEKIENASPAKVAVFLTKAPVEVTEIIEEINKILETSEILETEESMKNTEENNTNNIISNIEENIVNGPTSEENNSEKTTSSEVINKIAETNLDVKNEIVNPMEEQNGVPSIDNNKCENLQNHDPASQIFSEKTETSDNPSEQNKEINENLKTSDEKSQNDSQ